jgi:hypothetical protein
VPEAPVDVIALRPGLWTWTGLHPSWTPEDGGPEGWEQEVRSYAYDAGDSLVLFDPLVSPADIRALAGGRRVDVILTCRWHGRSAPELVEELGATVYTPAASIADISIRALPYERGADLPGSVEPHVGGYENEATLWVLRHNALVTGDVLLGGARGFRVQPDS